MLQEVNSNNPEEARCGLSNQIHLLKDVVIFAGFKESYKMCSSQNIKHKTQVMLDHIFSLTQTILEVIFNLDSSI
jgi:hypothetical protein